MSETARVQGRPGTSPPTKSPEPRARTDTNHGPRRRRCRSLSRPAGGSASQGLGRTSFGCSCASGEPLLAAHATIAAWPKGGEPWAEWQGQAMGGSRTGGRVLARWRQSGLSVRAFCRAEGVNEPMFYWWRRELQRARSGEARVSSRPRARRAGRVHRRGASKSFWPTDAVCGSRSGSIPRPSCGSSNFSKTEAAHVELASDRADLALRPTGRSPKIVRCLGRLGARGTPRAIRSPGTFSCFATRPPTASSS